MGWGEHLNNVEDFSHNNSATVRPQINVRQPYQLLWAQASGEQGPRQVPGTRKNENDPNRSAKSQIRAQQEQACHVLWGGHEQPPVQVGRKVKNSQARTGHQRVMGGRETDDDGT